MDGVVIILDNVGDDAYKQLGRDTLTNPITTSMMRVMLSSEAQIDNNIKIRNTTSFGKSYSRDLSLRNFIDSTTYSNLIIDIKLQPPIILDGQTYFETDLEALSEMDILFYYEQVDIGVAKG
jgi:hypothetical protein